MITQIRAENFKSWKDTGPLRLGKLTGLFGTNSSGKTSILQMLLMLKQTVESPDRRRVLHTGDERSLVDLGTFYDLIYGHQAEAKVGLSLSWVLREPLTIPDPKREGIELFRVKELSFTSIIRKAADRPVVEYFAYEFDSQSFGMKRNGGEGSADKDQYTLLHGNYGLKRARGRPAPLPSPVKCYGFPDEAMGYYQNTGFLPSFVLELERVFSQISYLGPLREYPKRSYVWAGERPVDVGRRGEQAIPALLAAHAERLTSGRLRRKYRLHKPIEELIAGWLQTMGLIETFSLKPIAPNRKDYEVRVKRSASSAEVLITDVGFGVSQILPVLVLCYYVPPGSTILLEQPEIHLHPSVQAGLADVFIDVVKERDVQIIVESHSEHLLRRLQRRIAEGTLPPDDTALYFCRMEDGTSQIEPLDVTLFGDITNWPKGFFGDEMGDLFAMTEAAMRRQEANP